MLHTVQCRWQRSWITFCDFVFVQLLQREKKRHKFKKRNCLLSIQSLKGMEKNDKSSSCTTCLYVPLSSKPP